MKKNIRGYQIHAVWKKIFLFSFLIISVSYLSVQTAGYKTKSFIHATLDGRASSVFISVDASNDQRSYLLENDISMPDSASGSDINTGPEKNYTPDLFAIIGDYGQSGSNESAVASLVKSWNPGYIITLGDNNYPKGASSTIDANIGKYYHSYIKPYHGFYGNGSPDVNRFFPSLGNHDIITSGGASYFQYFTLPGNERYYDFIKGSVHFFVINSNPSEYNGAWSTSVQANWLKNKLAASASKWKIVYFHHSPYASDAVHGSQAWMQWPFKQWGADVVFSSHSHVYERIIRDNMIYFVNGLGGQGKHSFKSTPVSGSKKRYNANFGAIQVMVKPDMLLIKFYSIYNNLIDSYSLVKPAGTVCNAKIIPGGSVTFCPGGSVTLYANTGSGFSYQWIKNGVNIPGATASSYKASAAGNYQVKVSFQGCTDWSAPLKVTVNTAFTAKITPGGPTTFCSGGKVKLYANTCSGYVYQWKKNGVNIPGATGPVYYASASGSYQLKIVQGSSTAWSAPLTITVKSCTKADTLAMEMDSVEAGLTDSNRTFTLNVYPNPTTGLFTFDFCPEEQEERFDARVINSIGQIVYDQPLFIKSGCIKETIELKADLPAGVYVLQIRMKDRVENVKLLLNR